MPKEITHCLFAEKAVYALAAAEFPSRRSIGREILFLFERQKPALFYGSVAPDIFYYDVAMPWEKKSLPRGAVWGDLVHGAEGEDTLLHVRQMLFILRNPECHAPLTGGRILTQEEHAMLALFVMGYLAHVALDTLLHPFVYYYSGNYYAENLQEKRRSEARHRALETIYDLFNLERFATTLKKYRPGARIYLKDEPRYLILSLYILGLIKAWPKLAAQEFGSDNMPEDARKHPLFSIAHRSYKKQLIFNKMFQSRSAARFGLWFNAWRNDSLHDNSSLLYPSPSYRDYLELYGNQALRIESLRTYRDPITNREHRFDPLRIEQRILARTQAMYRVVYLYLSGQYNDEKLTRYLRGLSLNNGRMGVATRAMRHFAPLPIDGNFRLRKSVEKVAV